MASHDWTRRQFLAASAVATCTLGNSGIVAAQDDSTEFDVAIIGAGISGLVAARDLVANGVENIVVLEARDRVGGRTINHDIGNGHVAEGGGQWIGPTQTAILDLCKELNVGTFPTYLKGRLIYRAGGSNYEVPYSQSRPSELEKRIDALAKSVPLNAPWDAPNAAEWDAMSLADWARKNEIRGDDRVTLSQAAALTLGTTSDALSFLYFLYYVHSAGSLHTLESMEGGAQDSRIEGGSQILSLRMAEELGDKVRLSSPVKSIRQTDDGVEVETSRGTIRAKQIIMALMPGICTRIAFDPPLPESRVKLQQNWIQKQDGLKHNVVYETPFWRKRGLNGMAISDGPVPFTTDNSPPDGSLGVLLILGAESDADQNPEKRERRIINALGDLFGPDALDYIGFHEMDWGKDDYTGGCVSPLEPGVLTKYGASLRESVGRIHWAGTEASEVWTGYMDGAVRAGKHTARKISSIVRA